jgi:site-specific DNA-methyltransferase (adenine-specific)
MKDKEIRIHPTQKPVALYDWIFKMYANEGMKILDTHLGSGSSRISADRFGVSEFVGIEIEEKTLNKHEKRWSDYKSQLRLW